MENIPSDLYYWKAIVNGEEWIVDGMTIVDSLAKIINEEPDADIESIEKTLITKIMI